MQLKVTRSQKVHGITRKLLFTLDARALCTDAELKAIKLYSLTRMSVYASAARKRQLDAAYAAANPSLRKSFQPSAPVSEAASHEQKCAGIIECSALFNPRPRLVRGLFLC